MRKLECEGLTATQRRAEQRSFNRVHRKEVRARTRHR
jgi:hypothetical protein